MERADALVRGDHDEDTQPLADQPVDDVQQAGQALPGALLRVGG
jgi:hypothetical protein